MEKFHKIKTYLEYNDQVTLSHNQIISCFKWNAIDYLVYQIKKKVKLMNIVRGKNVKVKGS